MLPEQYVALLKMTCFGNCDPTFWGFECCHECGLQRTVAWIEPQCPLLTQCLVRFPNPLADGSVPFKLFKSGGDPVYPGPPCSWPWRANSRMWVSLWLRSAGNSKFLQHCKGTWDNISVNGCFEGQQGKLGVWVVLWFDHTLNQSSKNENQESFFLVKSWTVHTPQYLID